MLNGAINWFEVPVTDFERARTFYQAIYVYEMPVNRMGPVLMGFFQHEQGDGIGGAIVHGHGYQPSSDGVKIYLNGGEDLNTVLERVAAAGGSVVTEKTEITPELGFFASFLDTEGNLIYIHSMG